MPPTVPFPVPFPVERRAPARAGQALRPARLVLAGLLLCGALAGCGSADSDPNASSGGLGGVAAREGGYRALIEDRRLMQRPSVDLAAGGVATTPWGAEIAVLPGTGQGEVLFTGTASGSPGRVVPDGVVVSAEHDLTAHGFVPGGTVVPFLVTLPVDASLVPSKVRPTAFAAQTFDEARGVWVPVKGLPIYDPQKKSVTFQAAHLSKWRVIKLVDLTDETDKFQFETDHFQIQYTLGTSFGQVSPLFPIDDVTWHSRGGRVGTDPQVPDYIEELARALEDARTAFLKLTASDGSSLYGEPWHPNTKMTVEVTHIADGAGDSRLGGPMRIKARLDTPTELRITAGHELMHVMQDQHYTFAGAAMNRWFLEASATLFSLRFAAVPRESRVNYYAREASDYLKASLDSSLEGSFYAAADFLEWLEARTGKKLTADVMQLDQTWDLSALSSLVRGATTTLGKYFTEYLLGASVGTHDFKATNLWTQHPLTPAAPAWRHEFKQYHLSGQALEIRTDVPANAMLVATSGRQYPYPKLQSHSYLGTAARGDVTQTLEAQTEAGKPVVVKNFGKAGTPGVTNSIFQQVIVNPNESDETVWEDFIFDYYLLEPPQRQGAPAAGRVEWSHNADTVNTLLKSPTITGFNVYQDRIRLNGTPLSVGNRSFSDPRIYATGDVQVTVVDRYGNEWPEVAPAAAVPFLRVRDICASFTYLSITTVSRMQQGPFSVVQCIAPRGTDVLSWAGNQFSIRTGDIYMTGVYDAIGPKLTSMRASRPHTGRYAKPPPLFELMMRNADLDPAAAPLVRFSVAGATHPNGYTINWQPEDDCTGGFCESRTVLSIDPASVTVSVTFYRE